MHSTSFCGARPEHSSLPDMAIRKQILFRSVWIREECSFIGITALVVIRSNLPVVMLQSILTMHLPEIRIFHILLRHILDLKVIECKNNGCISSYQARSRFVRS